MVDNGLILLFLPSQDFHPDGCAWGATWTHSDYHYCGWRLPSWRHLLHSQEVVQQGMVLAGELCFVGAAQGPPAHSVLGLSANPWYDHLSAAPAILLELALPTLGFWCTGDQPQAPNDSASTCPDLQTYGRLGSEHRCCSTAITHTYLHNKTSSLCVPVCKLNEALSPHFVICQAGILEWDGNRAAHHQGPQIQMPAC